jgi:hypothetical protein
MVASLCAGSGLRIECEGGLRSFFWLPGYDEFMMLRRGFIRHRCGSVRRRCCRSFREIGSNCNK